MLNWLMAKGLNGDQLTRAFETLDRLHRAIRVDQVIAFYIEKSQDIERVLNIFIRCNSGGTQLSYSNLLLSIAVSQWETRDAHEEVYRLVDEMNQIRVDLRFNADFVLKAGLMLTDIASVGFRVENFTQQNMVVLESNWEDIRQTLLETVVLVDSFGFDSRTIQATNSLLPIAYCLHQRAAPPGFATSDQYLDDRRAIRDWLTRSILKQAGIWGSGLDTLLTALRDVIRNAAGSRFPFAELCHTMAQRGKSLAFGEEEIEDLADIYAKDRRIFPLLTLLFPEMRSGDGSDVDHVFPRSRFTPTQLETAGIVGEQVEEFRDKSERIANLQLLDRTVNNEKRATLPADWLDVHCPEEPTRLSYCDRHLLGDVPREIQDFLAFYEARRQRLKERIRCLLGSMDKQP